MALFIAFCGFIGSWLLVAGPIYQAAQELKEEAFEREHIDMARDHLTPLPPISSWWWLVPPVKFLLESKRSKEYRRQFVALLPQEDVEAMVTFISKASAWLTVATGGLLIAITETYALVEQLHIGLLAFWCIVLAMALGSVMNTASRMAKAERIVGRSQTKG